jgi:hypothetical protein
VLAQALRASRPGQVVLILAPATCYQGWARSLARRGRRVRTPLAGLSLGQMLWQLLRVAPLAEVEAEQRANAVKSTAEEA